MSDQPALPRTRAEATDFRETSRHADVLAFLDELDQRTPLLRRTTMGRSGEGQDLAVALVSDKDCFTPEEARRQGKAIVMACANIHAGEVEGKEALLALCRDLTLTRLGQKILSKVCLVVIPNFNPDGNDRISPDNRRLDLDRLEGQVNPEGGVGTRYTGQGWNLNRDATKQEAPETQALAQLFHAWWPHVFVDCHTTNGSIHAFDLTFDTSHNNQELFARLLRYSRSMLEKISRRVEREHGFRSYWYGNYVREEDPESGWRTYPALPRFGSHYRGLLGRIDVLLETYSYLDFRKRYQVIYAWLLELVRFCAKNRRPLMRAVEREELRIIRRGQSYDPRPVVGINYGVARREEDGTLAFDYPAYALDGDEARIVAFDRASLAAHRYPGEEIQRYRAPHLRSFVPVVAVSTPAAYLVPAELADRLRGHGIRFDILDEDTELEVESYLILAIDKTHSPDVAGVVPPPGGAEMPLSQPSPPRRFETVLSVRAERRRVRFGSGTLLVRTAQRTGTLAVYLLEPHSDDGFARWEFLDAHLKVGELYPIHRLLNWDDGLPRHPA
ncbi:MAG: M14 family zinc carboxypeptidase [Myxococcales bacterium]|nr:M14 family zinc carboxypeptidase [Myxococcota bacterium]MDW8284144.1 M14 family zinc carboxypeptidase [Myxococcales bacterium]